MDGGHRPLIGGQSGDHRSGIGQAAFGQAHYPRNRRSVSITVAVQGNGGVGGGDLAGLDRDHISSGGAHGHHHGQGGNHVGVGEVTVQQQDFHQGPGAPAVTVRGPGRGPERLVLGGNTPDSRACTNAVAPGRAPGLRTSTSR